MNSMNSDNDLLLKRKVYISTIGWISTIFSGLLIYFSLLGIINIMIYCQNAIFKGHIISEDSSIFSNFSQIYSMIFTSYLLLIIVGILFLINSIGLIKYKDWARIFFMFYECNFNYSWHCINIT